MAEKSCHVGNTSNCNEYIKTDNNADSNPDHGGNHIKRVCKFQNFRTLNQPNYEKSNFELYSLSRSSNTNPQQQARKFKKVQAKQRTREIK